MPALDMRGPAVILRHDLAYALAAQGFPVKYIQAECKYASESAARSAINKGKLRADANEGRVSPRRFGVEIEFTGVTQRKVLQHMRDTAPEISMEIEGYNHSTVPYWKLITDSSVTSTYGSGDDDDDGRGEGNEMVSPILMGEQGFRELETVCRVIREAGGKIDSSCGLHVHHDARDLSPNGLALMLRFYMENQLVIDKFLAQVRRSTEHNQWCAPWRDDEKERVIRNVLDRNGIDGYGRYRTINTAPYSRYGSIEFRQHQGTLNYRKIANWVKLGQAIVESSIAKAVLPEYTSPSFVDPEPMLEWLVNNGSMPRSAADYLINRAAQYGA